MSSKNFANRVTRKDVASGRAVIKDGKWYIDGVLIITCVGKTVDGKRCPNPPRGGFSACKTHGSGSRKKESEGRAKLVANYGESSTMLEAHRRQLEKWDSEIVERVDKHLQSGPALADPSPEIAQMRAIMETMAVTAEGEHRCKFCAYQGVESFIKCETCGKIDTEDMADKVIPHLSAITKACERLHKIQTDNRNIAIVVSEVCAQFSEAVLRTVTKYINDEQLFNELQTDIGRIWANVRYVVAERSK